MSLRDHRCGFVCCMFPFYTNMGGGPWPPTPFLAMAWVLECHHEHRMDIVTPPPSVCTEGKAFLTDGRERMGMGSRTIENKTLKRGRRVCKQAVFSSVTRHRPQ